MGLLSWPNPVAGRPLVLYLMIRDDGIPTVCQTTPVVRINLR